MSEWLRGLDQTSERNFLRKKGLSGLSSMLLLCFGREFKARASLAYLCIWDGCVRIPMVLQVRAFRTGGVQDEVHNRPGAKGNKSPLEFFYESTIDAVFTSLMPHS